MPWVGGSRVGVLSVPLQRDQPQLRSVVLLNACNALPSGILLALLLQGSL